MGGQWRIGLVGCSRGSAYGHLAYHHPRCEVGAICDSDAEALARHQRDLGLADAHCFAAYEDLLATASSLDAVVIGTPIRAHAEQAVLALEAGLHVMSEVTASDTIDGCARIIKAARHNRRTYMLAENTIYRPLFREWERIIREGRLGEIIYAEADYLHPIPELLVDTRTGEKHWRADRPPVHYCSHSIGPLLYLMQDRIVRAMAIGDRETVLPGVGVGAVDIQLAAFETAKGAILKMTRTQVAPRHSPIHYYNLQGTRGFIETDRRGAGFTAKGQQGLLYIQAEMRQAEVVTWPELDASAPDWATLGGHGTCDYGTFVAFLHALETGQKPWLNEVHAWDLTVPGLIAAMSARQGGAWLEVPPPPGANTTVTVPDDRAVAQG